MTDRKAMLSGVFVIDAELYEDLTGEETDRGDLIVVSRFAAPDGDGANHFLHLHRGMSPENVAEGLRAAADVIEDGPTR